MIILHCIHHLFTHRIFTPSHCVDGVVIWYDCVSHAIQLPTCHIGIMVLSAIGARHSRYRLMAQHCSSWMSIPQGLLEDWISGWFGWIRALIQAGTLSPSLMTTLFPPISTWIFSGESALERSNKDQTYDSPYFSLLSSIFVQFPPWGRRV